MQAMEWTPCVGSVLFVPHAGERNGGDINSAGRQCRESRVRVACEVGMMQGMGQSAGRRSGCIT